MTGNLPGTRAPFALESLFLLLAALALCSGRAHADIYRSLNPDAPTKWTNTLPTEGRWELYKKDMPAAVPAQPSEPESVESPSPAVSKSRYASQIQAAAEANKVETALIRAVIAVESGYNPSAVSKAGAVGLMQLMPDTAKRYNVSDSHNPEQNIHGGARYLRDLLSMFNNNLHLVLAAYNAGEQAVMKYGNHIPPYRETLAYVPKVLKFYKQYSSGYASARESGDKGASAASRKTGTEVRVSRTYLPSPA